MVDDFVGYVSDITATALNGEARCRFVGFFRCPVAQAGNSVWVLDCVVGAKGVSWVLSSLEDV